MWRRMGSSWSSEKQLKPVMWSSESWQACTFKEVSNRSQKATKKTLPVSYHCLTFSVFWGSGGFFKALFSVEEDVLSGTQLHPVRGNGAFEQLLELERSWWEFYVWSSNLELARTGESELPTRLACSQSESCTFRFQQNKLDPAPGQPWVRPGWYRSDRITTKIHPVLIKNWNNT